MLDSFFGIDPKIIAISIMVVCYSIIFTEKINRAIIALFGGAAMVILGVLTQTQAIRSIDFNTLTLLMGMMIIVGITEKTGVFQFIAIWAAKKVRANPRGLLAVMTAVTALLSGYIDNVTTVLLITPIIIQITRTMEVKSFPYLMTMIFACNIGGAATLIGDPPNILIGSKLGLTFGDFIVNMTPLSYFLVVILIISFDLIWGRKLYASPEKRALITHMKPNDFITDKGLLKKSLFVLALVITAFIFAHHIGLDTGTIAILGAALMMLLYSFGDDHQIADEKVSNAFHAVDWTTIFFFAGLFIIVAGLEVTGILEIVGHKFVEWTGGEFHLLLYTFLWSAATISTIVDNIPFVATMMPIVETIENSLPGGREEAMPLWWSILMGACYGGNGSIIASSANVVVAGIAMRERKKIGFFEFMAWGVPVTLVSIAISSAYLYIVYL